jgi:hypothetical protein
MRCVEDECFAYKRKIVEDPLCPICGTEAETTGHVL